MDAKTSTGRGPVSSLADASFLDQGRIVSKTGTVWTVSFNSVEAACAAVKSFWGEVSDEVSEHFVNQEVTGPQLLQEFTDRLIDVRTDGSVRPTYNQRENILEYFCSEPVEVVFKAANGSIIHESAFEWLQKQAFLIDGSDV
jgi:hypothetical protein